ncbi:RNA polymerase subunit sigma-24 [Asticcacaulis sp. AC460]|uniref:sigma-70 family RNA polymerase sigma factor n=1 Tax=Asticcacaulis sp. AC460 TaxID=1282360 RepID=UPI0003C3F5F1|nr:sigma-70 family RNA polymerase sigma factor [Asticcacaulis sp. AC460]ESQ93247.1 RNA polymerase subunit sigma-24 [Asticcacaulis sp. AC460]
MNTYNSDEWQGWMRAALNGDAGLYRKLLAALRPWLLSYFRRRLHGGDCEDLVQMTLLSLHEKRHTYDVTAPFMPWIAAIARNKLIDYVRKAGRHVHVELDEAMGVDDGLRPDLAARDVKVLLGQLPKDQARIISLHKLNELSVEETAAATGKSASAVKVIVHRGLKKLQGLVGIKGGADE